MQRFFLVGACASLLLWSATSFGQTYKFTLDKATGKLDPAQPKPPASVGLVVGQDEVPVPVTIEIVSTAVLTPGDVSLTAGDKTPVPAAMTNGNKTATFTLRQSLVLGTKKADALPLTLAYQSNATPLPLNVAIYDDKAEKANLTGGGTGGKTSKTLIECLRGRTFRGGYDQTANRATFIITSSGNVLARPTKPIDEDDEIIVKIIGPLSLLEGLQVKRTSSFRDGTALRILGEPPAAPAGGNAKDQNGGADECSELTLSAGSDFEPGRGIIELTRLAGSEDAKVNEFDFGVNPLYVGALSFGPAYSKLVDESYGFTVNGSDTTLTVTNQSSPRVHYVLSYTQFIWGKRDVAKMSGMPFWQHINPTIAITIKNTFDNAFVGLTADLLRNSAYFTVGQHIGKVRRLDKTSGLEVGGKFKPHTQPIATVESWERDWFFALSIDLRAAIRFFNGALSSAPGTR